MPQAITLPCGCHASSGQPPRTRTIAERGRDCPMRHHQVGARVWLWELLVDPREPSIEDAGTRAARALQRRYQYLNR